MACNIKKDRQKSRELLNELESIVEEDDLVTRQFILRSRALLGSEEGACSPEETLEMLLEAIRLTVPKFDLEEINRGLYSLEEVKVINQIAGIYSNNGQNRKATNILGQLLKYVKKHNQNLQQSAGMFPFP